MGIVAAIQMTSGHIVAENLAAAAALLREAKDAGAEVACLPENFSFIGLRDADKLQVAEADGEGAVQSFLSGTARELGMWILGGTIVIRADSERRVANASLLIDGNGRRVPGTTRFISSTSPSPAATSNIANPRTSCPDANP